MAVKVKAKGQGRYLDCCEQMEQACQYTQCTPHIELYTDYDRPFIAACDGDLGDLPLNFCPWCGTSLKNLDWSEIL